MSVEAMAAVLHHSAAVGTAKLVLVGIANHEGDGGAWPSVATLAKYANADRRTVQRAIEKLVESGELRRRIQAGGTAVTHPAERPNLYEVTVVCPPECDRSSRHLMPGDKAYKGAYPQGAALTPPGGADAARGAAPTPPEPPTNHPKFTDQETTHVRNRASGHEHRFDPQSGYCGCGYRDDGRLVDIKTAREYQPARHDQGARA